MHNDIEEVLISEQALQARIADLAHRISEDYSGKSLLLVGILKGAVMFMCDLARKITTPLEIDFMAISSYGNSTESTGVVRILKDLDEPIEAKHVLIVEDIIDSGLTLKYLNESLQRRNPASLQVCTLLDKEKSREKGGCCAGRRRSRLVASQRWRPGTWRCWRRWRRAGDRDRGCICRLACGRGSRGSC